MPGELLHQGSLLSIEEFPDPVMVVTPAGRIRLWSQGAVKAYGHAAEVVLDQDIAELVVPARFRDEHRQRLVDAMAFGSVTYESIRCRSNGSLLYVDVTARRLARPGPDPVLLLLAEKDVTEIKVQRDAKLMEARFRDLLESTPDGIVMANPTGHIVIANSQAEKLFGYEPGELKGQLVDQLLPMRYRQAHVGHRSSYFMQPRKRAMGSGLDLAGLRKDGSEFPVEISLSPLRTEDSLFVMSAIRDISERKLFERMLQEKNLELASASQAKDRFLASMSHELRTPLNAIIGFTGTLLMRLPGPLTEDQERQLRTVQSSGRHLLALINDLLDVARIEADKVTLHLEPVDCNALMEEVAATLRPQAEGKGLAFSLALEAVAPVLQTDRRTLSQIVLNLTSNAIKFTRQGSVQLSVARVADNGGAGAIELSVHDTGPGIAREDIVHLFAPFNRLGGPANRDVEGTGLGLHLSQKLAKLLGGDIAVASEPGVGSRFSLRLHCEREA